MNKFVKDMSPDHSVSVIDLELINRLANELPGELIEILNQHGFNSYRKGLFRFVNPLEYAYLIKEWKNTEFFSLERKFSIIGITAFSKLLVWVKGGRSYLALYDPLYDDYEVISSKSFAFFLNTLIFDDSFLEIHFDLILFDKAQRKCGKLRLNEVYGFTPIPMLGGNKSLEFAEIYPLKEYIEIIGETLY